MYASIMFSPSLRYRLDGTSRSISTHSDLQGVWVVQKLAPSAVPHVQFHTLLPVTAEALPTPHKFVYGALALVVLFADPHAHGGGNSLFALHEATAPEQIVVGELLHVHNFVTPYSPLAKLIVEGFGVPAVHNGIVGAVAVNG